MTETIRQFRFTQRWELKQAAYPPPTPLCCPLILTSILDSECEVIVGISHLTAQHISHSSLINISCNIYVIISPLRTETTQGT